MSFHSGRRTPGLRALDGRANVHENHGFGQENSRHPTLEVEDGKTIDAFLVAMDEAYAADIEDGMLFNDDRVTLTILTSWPGISGFQDFVYVPEDHPEILTDKTIDRVCLVMINTVGSSETESDRKVGVSLSFSKGVRAASLVAGIVLSLPAFAVFLVPAVRALKKRLQK
jgi:hypothetical protein